MAGRVSLRLFHFSDDATIATFEPRPVRIAAVRPPGREWLNGPLVWAIDAAHAFMYLFPRDCPRLLAWATAETSLADRTRWLGSSRVVAYVEMDWRDRMQAAELTRYELAPSGFVSLDDAGMWVSRHTTAVLGRQQVRDLPQALADAGVELRFVAVLGALRQLYTTSLHVSGIRLRNAPSWIEA